MLSMRHTLGMYFLILFTGNGTSLKLNLRNSNSEASRSPHHADAANVAGEQHESVMSPCVTPAMSYCPTPLPATVGQAELANVQPTRRVREDSPDGRGLRNEYRFLSSMSIRDNAASLLGTMSSRHLFYDLDQNPFKYDEEFKAAKHLAMGTLYRIKLDTEKKTVLTRMKEAEAIRGGLIVVAKAIQLQCSVLERPIIGAAVTGPAVRDNVGRLSSVLDTANRLKFVAEAYHSVRISHYRQLDRKVSATKAYIQAAQVYLQRANRPLGPYASFTPPQPLPDDVFTGPAFTAADFKELDYDHVQAVVNKYSQYVPETPHFTSPEDLAICHRCRGPPGHGDYLYQTERDVLDHVKVLYLQHVLATANGAELDASYQLQSTINYLAPLGNALQSLTKGYLQACNDLHAIHEGVNAETPSKDLGTTHIEGYSISGAEVGPYHTGSLSLAIDHLGHALSDQFTVTRHEYVLAGDLETRISRNDTLLTTIQTQLRAIHGHAVEFLDYEPIARLPKTVDGTDMATIDTELTGLRNSFISLLTYLK